MPNFPSVTFGIIVLNGQPFVPYCLRSIYPFAHRIIVVEGACEKGTKAIATPEGHSSDGTLESLQKFKNEEDPEDKVQIITRDGFWKEKDEQSQAYATLADGEYLWQVDIDEFYKPEDVRTVLEMLRQDPSITAVSFQQITFWGGFDYVTDGWYLRRGASTYHRLFKWGQGFKYTTHRPPTVVDSLGRNLRNIKWVNGKDLAAKGIYLYHYSLTFPKQVMDKCEYYKNAEWASRPLAAQWAQDVFLNLKKPFRVHNVYEYPSWLNRFQGNHPFEIQRMQDDLDKRRLTFESRRTDDIETLLKSPSYKLRRFLLKALEPLDSLFRPVWIRFIDAAKSPVRIARKFKTNRRSHSQL